MPEPAFWRLRIESDPERADALADLLDECGALSVSFEDAGDAAHFEPTPDAPPRLWPKTRVIGLFPAGAREAYVRERVRDALGETAACDTEPVADQDWARAWLSHYAPLRFGERLWVCPSWLTPPEPAAVTVFIDPGLAFGTGTHATTGLCLEWFARSARVEGADVLDYGCGSGILAIAALKLGARAAIGVDIDARALDAARENAVRNGVGANFEVVAHDALPADTRADIVVANILADPLVALAPRLLRHLRPGGALLLSGVLATQVEEVRRAYRGIAFEVRVRDDWALLSGEKPS